MERVAFAALFVVAGTATVAISDNVVPLAAEEMGLWQLMVLRSVVSLPIAIGFAWAAGRLGTLAGRATGAVAVRGALAATALLLYFGALPAVGIALAAAGMFTSPLWIMILSALILRERIGPRRILAGILGFVGVCLVLGVGTVPFEVVMLLPLAAGLFYGASVMWTRARCSQETSICLATWQTLFFLAAGVTGLALAPGLDRLFGDVPGTDFITMAPATLTARGFWLASFVGVMGLLGASLLATGYRSGRSSVVGLFDYSFLIWAPLFAWLMRGEAISVRMVAGMVLIAAAGMLALIAGRDAEARQAGIARKQSEGQAG